MYKRKNCLLYCLIGMWINLWEQKNKKKSPSQLWIPLILLISWHIFRLCQYYYYRFMESPSWCPNPIDSSQMEVQKRDPQGKIMYGLISQAFYKKCFTNQTVNKIHKIWYIWNWKYSNDSLIEIWMQHNFND